MLLPQMPNTNHNNIYLPYFCRMAFYNYIRRDILNNPGMTSHISISSNGHKRLDTNKPHQLGAPLDHNMSSQQHPIRQKDIIFYDAIMCNMHTCHKEVVVPDNRFTSATCRTGINRYTFPDNIIVTHFKKCTLTAVFKVLRFCAQNGIRMDNIIFPYGGISSDCNMVFYNRTLSNRHISAYYRKRANFNFFL